MIAGHTYAYDADLRTEILAVCAGEPRSLQQIATDPDIIFSDFDNVIPDLVWLSQGRLIDILDDRKPLTLIADQNFQ